MLRALNLAVQGRCEEDGERRAVGLDRSESNPRLGATSGGGGRGWAAEGAATAGAIARMAAVAAATETSISQEGSQAA